MTNFKETLNLKSFQRYFSDFFSFFFLFSDFVSNISYFFHFPLTSSLRRVLVKRWTNQNKTFLFRLRILALKTLRSRPESDTPQSMCSPWWEVSDVLKLGPGWGPSWLHPHQRDGNRCGTALLLQTQTGRQQQSSPHQVKNSRRPATEQSVPELPPRQNLRHRLVKELYDRDVSYVRDRDEPQDPGNQAKRPPCHLHRPLAPEVLQAVVAAVDHMHAGDRQQESEQSRGQRHTHEDPGQFDFWGKAEEAVVGPALQRPMLLHHTGLPQPPLIALCGQQVGG